MAMVQKEDVMKTMDQNVKFSRFAGNEYRD